MAMAHHESSEFGVGRVGDFGCEPEDRSDWYWSSEAYAIQGEEAEMFAASERCCICETQLSEDVR
jgi:hypothetical protein